MWPFTKQSEVDLHPLLQEFTDLMKDARSVEWFNSVTNGFPATLPISVASRVNQAIRVSNTISSMTGVSSIKLLSALRSNDLRAINERLKSSGRSIDESALDSARLLSRIVEWANDYNVPELRAIDTISYKEAGVPRDIRKLKNLRYLFVTDDHGITELPEELAHLPLLQAICVSNNKIHAISPALYKCPSLQRLDLEDNEITRIEDGIDALRNVCAIDLSGNKLEHVTPDIAKMPSLRQLDVRNQKTEIDFMRAANTPLSEASLDAMYRLVERIDVKY